MPTPSRSAAARRRASRPPRGFSSSALLVGALVGALVGTLSACTSGTPGPTGASAGASPSPTVPDPSAADVRSTGTPLTPNGITVTALPGTTTTLAANEADDGSVRLRLVVTPAAPTGPLAWLTGPDGSTAAVLEDGSALITGADGSFLVGLTAPTPSARFTVVGTPAAELRVDRVAPEGLAESPPTAPVSTWIAGQAVVSAVWGEAEGGRSLEITPSPWARTGTLAAQQALWSQLVAEHPEANSPSMHEQLLCHVLGAAGKTTWHIEPWRPQVDALTMLRTRCNPTAADATAAPAASAATGG